MSLIKSLAKFLSIILVLGLFGAGFFFVILPNKSFFDDISAEFTESIFGVESKTGWVSEHYMDKNIKSGFYIRPYILGVQTPRVWISSKDSINVELISEWKMYDASF